MLSWIYKVSELSLTMSSTPFRPRTDLIIVVSHSEAMIYSEWQTNLTIMLLALLGVLAERDRESESARASERARERERERERE